MADARTVIAQSGHTRFPVFDRDLDDVIGILYARDLFVADDEDRTAPIEPLIKAATFVPRTKRATELLPEMRRTRRQMTFVVDEHGSLVGLITTENLVEVIVGEIPDEHTPPEEPTKVLTEGVIEADASLPVHQLNEELELDLPESSNYVTIAGLVLERIGTLPQGGETVDAPPYRLTVTGMDGKRIAHVRITTMAPAEA